MKNWRKGPTHAEIFTAARGLAGKGILKKSIWRNAQETENVFLHVVRAYSTMKMRPKLSMRAHIAMTAFLSCTTVPVFGARSPWSAAFFSCRHKKKVAKEKNRRHGHSGLRFWGRCGSASVGAGGCPEPTIFVSYIFQKHIFFDSISIHDGADPKHDEQQSRQAVRIPTFVSFLTWPWKFCVVPSALPYADKYSNKEADPYMMKIIFTVCGSASFV